jgi:hypothetical protein
MAGLLLEEILEGLASVWRTAGNGFRKRCGDLRGLLIRSGRGVLFDGGTEFVELAIILAVLGSDALRDGLRTFKLRAGIEEAALLAAMKFRVALGTGARGIEAGSENGSAIGAAGAGDSADHAGSAGTEMIVLAAGTTLRRFTFGAGLLFFVAIAVAAMAVLTVHKYLRTLTLTLNSSRNELGKFASQHSYTYENRFGRFTHCTLMCPILVVSNRIATLGAARDTSLKFLVQNELPATKSRRRDNLVCNSMGIRSQERKRRIV